MALSNITSQYEICDEKVKKKNSIKERKFDTFFSVRILTILLQNIRKYKKIEFDNNKKIVAMRNPHNFITK